MNDVQSVLAALVDPNRRALLERLRKGPRAVGELVAGLRISQPAVSQHLHVLRAAGLVQVRRAGTRRIYRLCPDGLEHLAAWIDAIRQDRAGPTQ